MTIRTATILTRTEPEVKRAADAIFARLGLTTSGAINIFLHQSIEEQGLPFRAHITHPDIPDLGELSRDETKKMLEEGHQEVLKGQTRPVAEVLAELRAKHGL